MSAPLFGGVVEADWRRNRSAFGAGAAAAAYSAALRAPIGS